MNNLTCHILLHNVIYFLSFTVVYYLYILMVVIIIYFICSNQSSKYQVKDMNVYIEPLINELLKLWDGTTMYDVSKPIRKLKFQLHAMLVWTIHDASGLAHFCSMQ